MRLALVQLNCILLGTQGHHFEKQSARVCRNGYPRGFCRWVVYACLACVTCRLSVGHIAVMRKYCNMSFGVLSLVLTSADVFHTLRLVLAARQSDSRGTTGRESRLYSFASSSGAFCMVLNAEESESLAGETCVPRSTWLQ